MTERVFSPSALIAEVNALLEQGFSGIEVEGEITNASASGRGHLYFCLKDDRAQLDAVMWSSRARALRFELEDGLAVRARGSLTIYPQRGRFQLVVDALEPQGIGALQLAFEQLKRRLDAEGLFAAERKRPLPALPNRVGIVTSATGAALQDMLRVLGRVAHLEVVVAPATVQGAGAAAEIADAIGRLGASGLVEVVIVGRGGGSLEDLWAFNEEAVARAIAACPVPVISAVGHEVDFTIADFVADIRAATPTQAAELVASRIDEQVRRLDAADAALGRDIRRLLTLARAELRGLEGSRGLAGFPQRVASLRARFDRARRLGPALRRLVESTRNRLVRAEGILARLPGRLAAGGHRRLVASRWEQMAQLIRARLARAAGALEGKERALVNLSPRRVLERGYSITTVKGSSRPIRDPAEVRTGQVLLTRLARGELRSLVADGPPPRRPKATVADRQPSLFSDATDEPGEGHGTD
ncbi:MAG TPA: exodeoxyribonuclease VII large subunit [Candidatus Sulfomarinibacteraceae bacterium]|nr:exodeoxyribonuclease VII large subunit [Candidatus Sulfomarinibacteraceae bacterium]